ncbi:hypothetical protein Smp_073820 [Schistosoma mansoni]|uniref:hypothetical protein n=1 Tax=Schistosoma mansoni TaxID=6183 RepID=UPI0001A624BB|nr:hypothetical protein Smp_073820 [Schistosoma mansoni]|eukprot:XP_018648811.1 hypothetical protein Smp_073820 [Schistosoma mansoni]
MATPSKDGIRRENYLLLARGGSDEKYVYGTQLRRRNSNECNLSLLTRTNWRASLVPAAAITPAPKTYIKVAAVKKLVVGSGSCDRMPLFVHGFDYNQDQSSARCSGCAAFQPCLC